MEPQDPRSSLSEQQVIRPDSTQFQEELVDNVAQNTSDITKEIEQIKAYLIEKKFDNNHLDHPSDELLAERFDDLEKEIMNKFPHLRLSNPDLTQSIEDKINSACEFFENNMKLDVSVEQAGQIVQFAADLQALKLFMIYQKNKGNWDNKIFDVPDDLIKSYIMSKATSVLAAKVLAASSPSVTAAASALSCGGAVKMGGFMLCGGAAVTSGAALTIGTIFVAAGITVIAEKTLSKISEAIEEKFQISDKLYNLSVIVPKEDEGIVNDLVVNKAEEEVFDFFDNGKSLFFTKTKAPDPIQSALTAEAKSPVMSLDESTKESPSSPSSPKA